jgi:colanic acid/amylovoran biosynthesis glycosyltransferase
VRWPASFVSGRVPHSIVPSALVAHVVRDGGVLTEPFIGARVSAPVPGFRAEQWSERGTSPDDIELVTVGSRLIGPGSMGARAFHHVPQLGWLQARRYASVASTRRPDLVHAHYLTTGYLAIEMRRPLVVSAYGFDVSVMAGRPLWARAFRDLARSARAVLVEGPHMRESVIRLGFLPDRVRVVRIAVGHEHLTFRSPTPLAGRAPRLVTAGRFVEKKGIDTAIEAFGSIRTRWPGSTLSIVGAGPLEARLRTKAANDGGEGIQFVGTLPRENYLELLSEADVLLAPSRTARNGDSEGGAPTTILDAQAVGTIVVGSTHADIPFVLADGETGFLAPEGDVAGFTTAVERALNAADRWPVIAAAARADVVANHAGSSLSAALSDVYSRVLADR